MALAAKRAVVATVAAQTSAVRAVRRDVAGDDSSSVIR